MLSGFYLLTGPRTESKRGHVRMKRVGDRKKVDDRDKGG